MTTYFRHPPVPIKIGDIVNYEDGAAFIGERVVSAIHPSEDYVWLDGYDWFDLHHITFVRRG